jgi:hypothetical protein
MDKKRIEKLWADYRYRVDRAPCDVETQVTPEESIELLEALLDEEGH